MVSSEILSQIRQQKQELINHKQHPIVVKMSSATWDVLADSELLTHFGDIEPHKSHVLDLLTIIDNSLSDGVTRVYTDWATAMEFPYA